MRRRCFVPVKFEPVAAAVVELRLPTGVVMSLPTGETATLAAAIKAAARVLATTEQEAAAC